MQYSAPAGIRKSELFLRQVDLPVIKRYPRCVCVAELAGRIHCQRPRVSGALKPDSPVVASVSKTVSEWKTAVGTHRTLVPIVYARTDTNWFRIHISNIGIMQIECDEHLGSGSWNPFFYGNAARCQNLSISDISGPINTLFVDEEFCIELIHF